MKIRRNAPCPCGSGKKYKKCCLGKDEFNIEISKDYFSLKGQNAERMLSELAKKTFLTDWCYVNPKLPSGKELCDFFVVFDNIAIIWQIKDLKLDEQGKYKRAEVEKNIRQLSGARRQLIELQTQIELENPRRGKEMFDPKSIKEIYLISVLFGDPEAIFSLAEDIESYTAHVFTREFTEIILSELDTVADFTDYLREKESFFRQKKRLIITGGEEELLAYYLFNERSLRELEKADQVIMTNGSWEHLQKKPEYMAKKKEDKISYCWDSIINRAHECGTLEYEIITRELARINRFKRRILSKVFFDAHLKAHSIDSSGLFRRIVPDDGVTYCFLFQDDPEPRDCRKDMLRTICFIARGLYKQNKKVLGIATEKKIQPLCSYDFCLFDEPDWTDDMQKQMDLIQSERKIFTNPIINHIHEDEYPDLSKSPLY